MEITKWLLPDGGINTALLDELEMSLKAVTDKYSGLVDQVMQKGWVPVFRCSHSGLLLPGDTVKEWGRGYGSGLGPSPVSEVLDSDYHTLPPMPTAQTRLTSLSQIMHPTGPCMAQIDMIMVPAAEAEAKAAVLRRDDLQCKKRTAIVYEKQLKNPRGKVAFYRSAFQKELRA